MLPITQSLGLIITQSSPATNDLR